MLNKTEERISRIISRMDNVEKLMAKVKKGFHIGLNIYYYVAMVFCVYWTFQYSQTSTYYELPSTLRLLLIIGIALAIHKLFAKRTYFSVLRKFMY